jgi:hypothetical protein
VRWLEEIFFRGIILAILVRELRVNASIGIALVGDLFGFQQLVQLRTWYQAAIIGSSCISISLVGGMLALLTGGVVPAAIAHASFVVFYVSGIRK